MSLFEIASQGSGHQVSDSAEPLRRINASVPGHDQAEWLALLLQPGFPLGPICSNMTVYVGVTIFALCCLSTFGRSLRKRLRPLC